MQQQAEQMIATAQTTLSVQKEPTAGAPQEQASPAAEVRAHRRPRPSRAGYALHL